MNSSFIKPAGGQPGLLNRWGPTVLIVGVLALYALSARSAGPPPGWGSDFLAASEEASASNRRIVVDFYSDGCAPCVAMDREVLGTERVQEALKAFVPVRINAWKSGALKARYGVNVTPTFLILSPDESPILGTEGFLSETEFIAFLAQGESASAPSAPQSVVEAQAGP